MKNKNKEISPKIAALVFGVLVLLFAIGFYTIGAWTPPGAAPPGANVPAPINVGPDPQIKAGPLQVSGFRNLGGTILDGNVGIGTTAPAERLHILGSIRGNQAGALRISTGHGFLDIGPKNPGWAHIMTDRPRFYFNTGIDVDTGLIGSHNEDLQLQTSRVTRITVSNVTGNVGIGDTTPDARLDVAGTARVDGILTAVGGITLGGVHRATWPVGGVGDITAVTAGAGLTGGGTVGAVTLNVGAGSGITVAANTVGITTGGVTAAHIATNAVGTAEIISTQVQRRVTGSCPAGQSIRSINHLGAVVCEPDDVGVISLSVRRRSASGIIVPTTFMTRYAVCPTGYTASGGGFTTWEGVSASGQPSLDGVRWRCLWRNYGAINVGVVCWVQCIRLVK